MSAARTKVYVDIVTRSDGKAPGTGLKKFAIGAGIATTALVLLVRQAKVWSDAASDAEEIGSKYATIFRDIRGEAEEMADKFAESFGLAGSTSRELLGNTADLLTGLGFTQKGALDLSEQVNTLAADLASFSNFAGGTTGASEALTKALLGEAESVKALGIVINQNTREYKDAIKFYTEVEGKTLLQAKAFTALQFATEQSGNAIGDVSRTFNSSANVARRYEESIKELEETLGVAVNQGLTPFKIALIALTDAYTEIIAKQNTAAALIRDFADGAIDADMTMSQLVETMEALVSLRKQGGRGALVEEIEAIQALIDNYDHVNDRIDAKRKALESAEAIRQLAQDAEDEAIAKALDRQDQLTEAFKKTKEGQIAAIEKQIEFFETFEPQGPMAIAILRDLNEELDKLTGKSEEAVKSVKSIWDLDISRNPFDIMRGSIEAQGEEVEKLNTIIVAAGEDWFSLEQEKVDHLIFIDDLQTAMNKRRLAEAAKEQAEIDKTIAKYEGFVNAGLNPLIQAFSNVGDAGANTWEVMKQAGKDAISGILKSFAQLWTARAVASLVALDFIGAAGWSIAAAGAVAASSTVQNFAHGGQFITDGPTLIGNNLVGDNASGQERVTVEPLGGGGDQSGRRERFELVAPGYGIIGYIQKIGINNGGLHSSRGGRL